MWFAFMTVGFLESSRNLIVVSGVVYFAGIGNQVDAAFLEKPNFMKHARQGSHGKSASAEAKQKYSVVRLVPVHEIAVGIFYVFRETKSKGLAHKHPDLLSQG